MAQSFTKGIPIDTDGTMAANSDGLVSSQQAIVEYVTNSGAGSGWKFLSSATAAASAELLFESDIDATFQMYAFVYSDIQPATNGAKLWMRTSTDGGTGGGGSYDSGASDYTYKYYGTAASTPANYAQIEVSYVIGNTGSEAASGIVFMYNPLDTQYTKVNFQSYSISGAGAAGNSINGGGNRWSIADVNAVQFLMLTGNMTSGSIRLYGCCTPA